MLPSLPPAAAADTSCMLTSQSSSTRSSSSSWLYIVPCACGVFAIAPLYSVGYILNNSSSNTAVTPRPNCETKPYELLIYCGLDSNVIATCKIWHFPTILPCQRSALSESSCLPLHQPHPLAAMVAWSDLGLFIAKDSHVNKATTPKAKAT